MNLNSTGDENGDSLHYFDAEVEEYLSYFTERQQVYLRKWLESARGEDTWMVGRDSGNAKSLQNMAYRIRDEVLRDFNEGRMVPKSVVDAIGKLVVPAAVGNRLCFRKRQHAQKRQRPPIVGGRRESLGTGNDVKLSGAMGELGFHAPGSPAPRANRPPKGIPSPSSPTTADILRQKELDEVMAKLEREGNPLPNRMKEPLTLLSKLSEYQQDFLKQYMPEEYNRLKQKQESWEAYLREEERERDQMPAGKAASPDSPSPDSPTFDWIETP